MPAKGQNRVKFDPRFFDELERSAGVSNLCKESAQRVLNIARSTAPVHTGAYRRGLQLEKSDRPGRVVWRVIGTDAKTMLVESKTGNLVKALRRANRG